MSQSFYNSYEKFVRNLNNFKNSEKLVIKVKSDNLQLEKKAKFKALLNNLNGQ
jgi:hypothetical protein